MKKQIKSVSSRSVKGIITVTILSATLCAFGAKANNKPAVAINAVKVEMKSENGVESRMNSIAEINNEAVEQYNAGNFVEAELAFETESWMNSGDETNYEAVQYNANEYVEAEMALETESMMNSNVGNNNEAVQYNAEEFAEADLALEIESWMNNNCF